MRSTRNDKVLLQSVKTLTFHKDGMTKARRTTPIRKCNLDRQWIMLTQYSSSSIDM